MAKRRPRYRCGDDCVCPARAVHFYLTNCSGPGRSAAVRFRLQYPNSLSSPADVTDVPLVRSLVYVVLYVVLALHFFVGWKSLVDYLQGMITDLSLAAAVFHSNLQGIATGTSLFTQSFPGVAIAGLDKILQVMVSTLRVVYTHFLAKIIGREPFPDFEKPTGLARGFLSQFLLDESVEQQAATGKQRSAT
jgi:hypothetical protein